MGIRKMAAHLKVVFLLVLGISSALSSPHPDFSVQPGDEAHDHHHEHHHHAHEDHGREDEQDHHEHHHHAHEGHGREDEHEHHDEDGEPLAPPPPEEEAPAGSSFLPPENPQTYGGSTSTPAPSAPIQKECTLVTVWCLASKSLHGGPK